MKLYRNGIRRYVWLLCGYNHLPARRTVLYHCDTASKNVAPDDRLKNPKHVERLMIKYEAQTALFKDPVRTAQ